VRDTCGVLRMKKMGIVQLAVRNLKRKPVRNVALLLIVAVVTGTLFAATIFISGMRSALKLGTYRLGADVLVVPAKYENQAKSALLAGEPVTFYMKRDVYDRVKKIEGVKNAAAQLFIKPSSFTCCFNVEVFLIAFEPDHDFTIMPWLKKNLKKPLTDSEVIVGSSVPVIPGDLLPFFGSPFTVAGTMEPTGMKFFDSSVFMTMDAAYEMAKNSKERAMQPIEIGRDQISTVLVQVQDGITPDRVAIRIEHDIDGVKAIASDEVISTVRRQLGGLLKGILAISGVLWALALLMMGFAFYMIVNERQRELGLLRAMGAKKGHVFRLIVTEAVMISLAGGVLGTLAGFGGLLSFKEPIIRDLKLPYLLPPASSLVQLVVAAMVFALVTGLLSALLPAFSASKMEPYEAIRKGE
jgi:putative ABC transport system permease protein